MKRMERIERTFNGNVDVGVYVYGEKAAGNMPFPFRVNVNVNVAVHVRPFVHSFQTV